MKRLRLDHLLASLLAAALLHAQTGKNAERTTKFGIEVRPGPMDSLLLKDYQPEVSLVVPATEVRKARFPVIDIHAHSGQSHIRTAADVADWVRTMDEVGIETTVVFTGATGAEFERQAQLFSKHRSRFQLWCSLDTDNIAAADYPQRAAR